PRRPDLKLVVTSATIDTARFAAHFGDAPVVSVEGRGYPVEVRYRPLEEMVSGTISAAPEAGGRPRRGIVPDTISISGIVAACDEIQRDKGIGDTLVFLP